MRSLIHLEATARLIRDNEPRFSSLEETIVNLEKAGEAGRNLEERVWGVVEHVDVEGGGGGGGDGDGKSEETGFATVWTKFRIDVDGEVSPDLMLLDLA